MGNSGKRIFVLDTGHSRMDLFADPAAAACTHAWDREFPRAGWTDVRRALRLVSSCRWDLAVVNMREFCFFRRNAGGLDGIWRFMRGAWKHPREIGELLVFARLVKSGVPIALVNRSDRGGVWDGSDWFFRNCHACFIRELHPDPRWSLLDLSGTNLWARRLGGSGALGPRDWNKLRPISLGLPDPESFPSPAPKEFDVLYGHGRDFRDKPLRDRLVAELQDACRRLGLNLKLVDRVSKAEWIRLMAASRLVFSPPGVGWDCWRHYEAMMAGAIPLMTYPTILRHQPPVEGVEGFYFAPEPGGLERGLTLAWSQRNRFQEISSAGRDLVLRHHTFPKLRGYVIGETFAAFSRPN